MALSRSIIAVLVCWAGTAQAQQHNDAAQDAQLAQALADAGIVQAMLPADWGQLRDDIKGGNPLLLPAPNGDALWRPDTVQSLRVPEGWEPAETLIDVQIDGAMVTLRLQPRPLQASDPVVMVQHEDGRLERYMQLPSNLYTGAVDNHPDSWVRASFRNGKLHATIQMSATSSWRIQPLSDVTRGGDESLHMVWNADNPGPAPEGRCGVEDEPAAQVAGVHIGQAAGVVADVPANTAVPVTENGQANEPRTRPLLERMRSQAAQGDEADASEIAAVGNPWDAMLAVDVDCYIYNNYDNVQDTVDFVYQVIGEANARYQQRFGYDHLVTHILVRIGCTPDPYETANPDAAGEMLAAMRNDVWTMNNPVPRNIAMLFTGRNLDGTTIGLAYQPSACSNLSNVSTDPRYNGGHCLIEADWTIFNDGRYTVAKHELGHTWGASHACGSCCNGDQCSVMCATVCATTNSDFLSTSISQINAFRSTATCNAHLGDVWYVDARNPYSIPNGNANHPFKTFLDGYNAAPDNGIVQVRGYGSATQYVHGPRVYNRPMTVRAAPGGGVVRIR